VVQQLAEPAPLADGGRPISGVQSIAQKPGQPAVCLSTCVPAGVASPLANWPIQLRLVSPNAPYLKDADLLLVADCVAFALADFHRQVVRRRPVLIGCPKLDDGNAYVEKLAQILAGAAVRSLTVVHMSVPCCTGLLRIAEAAQKLAGSNVPFKAVVITPQGEIVAVAAPPAPLTNLTHLA
jgi:hypothetical protein